MPALNGLAADPYQQHADQRVHHHVPRRLIAGVLVLQARKEAVEVVTVVAGGIAAQGVQAIQRRAQLPLQMRHQRRGQGDHKAFDVFGKPKTMHA